MKHPGLYIVTLNNVTPISVNANDRRIADKCILVTSANCKFGKAKNLATRSKNYEKVFGANNVNFFPIIAIQDIAAAENAVLNRLLKWRIRGNSGRLNEWLEGINPDEVERIALTSLTEANFAFQHIGSVRLAPK